MEPYDEARLSAFNDRVIGFRRGCASKFRLACRGRESMTVHLPHGAETGSKPAPALSKDLAMTTPHLDEALIERLIEDRIDARRARDFAKADSIRKALDGMGLVIIDGKDEETGALWTTWDVRSDVDDEAGPKE